MDPELLEYPVEASIGLCNVLDSMGLSDNQIKLYTIQKQLLGSLLHSNYIISGDHLIGYEFVLVGSFAEGPKCLSALSRTQTDIDVLRVLKRCTLYEHPDNAAADSQNMNWQFLMEGCPKDPGYVRLQVLREGTFTSFPHGTWVKVLFENTNESENPYLTNNIPSYFHNSGLSGHVMHQMLQFLQCFSLFENANVSGPAFSFVNSSNLSNGIFALEKMDVVFAIGCPEWPSVANEWVERTRLNGWPSQELISKQVRLGCYVVPVGCKQCDKTYLDWRLSFTCVEQALIQDFNATQLKSFLLLKHLKATYIDVKIDKISSYIIKTTLFWTIEETPSNLWRPDRLLKAVRAILDKLISFIKNDFCPNYFIRKCNLLAFKYNSEEKIEILKYCSDVRQNLLEMLCQTSPFQEAFQSRYIEHVGAKTLSSPYDENTRKIHSFFISICTDCVICPILWMSLSCQQTMKKALEYCKKTLLTFTKEICPSNITKYGTDCIRTAILNQLKKLLWSYCFLRSKTNKYRYACQRALHNCKDEDEVNHLSSKVILYHLHVVAGNYSKCNDKLRALINAQRKQPYMRISSPAKLFFSLESTLLNLYSTLFTYIMDTSQLDFPFIWDIFFTRFEVNLLPVPLQMEIYSDQGKTKSFDLSAGIGKTAIVDPLVYACFLRFWCCVKLDRNIEKLQARKDLEWACSLPNITNKAVAFNLLGYCHNQLEEYNAACTAFCRALKESPRSPATIIHIASMINDRLWREWSEIDPGDACGIKERSQYRLFKR